MAPSLAYVKLLERAGIEWIKKTGLPVLPTDKNGVPVGGKYKFLYNKFYQKGKLIRIFAAKLRSAMKQGERIYGIALAIPSMVVQDANQVYNSVPGYHIVIDTDAPEVLEKKKDIIDRECSETLCIKTPRGMHIHYWCPDPVNTKYFGGIDLISFTHMSQLAPSIRVLEDGREYEYTIYDGKNTIAVRNINTIQMTRIKTVRKEYLDRLLADLLTVIPPRKRQERKRIQTGSSPIPRNPIRPFNTVAEFIEFLEANKDNVMIPKCLRDLVKQHPRGERFIYGMRFIVFVNHLVKQHTFDEIEELFLKRYLVDYPEDERGSLESTLRYVYEKKYWGFIASGPADACHQCVFAEICPRDSRVVLLIPAYLYIATATSKRGSTKEEILVGETL